MLCQCLPSPPIAAAPSLPPIGPSCLPPLCVEVFPPNGPLPPPPPQGFLPPQFTPFTLRKQLTKTAEKTN